MATTIEAPSPATSNNSGDATNASSKRLGNLSTSQAAVLLMANAGKAAQQQPTRQAPEETAPNAEAEANAGDQTNETPNAEEALAATSDPTQQTTEGAEAAAAAGATPKGEAEADSNSQATEGGEAEAVHSQTISFTPEQQALLNKRIGKEVAKTKALKEQMEQTKAKLAELETKLSTAAAPAADAGKAAAAPIVIPANVPLGDVNDIASLGQRQQAAKEAIRYVEAVLDDQSQWQTITDPQNESREIKVHKIGDQLYTESDLKKSMRVAKVTLEDHIPQRAQFLATKQQATQQAHVDFPFLTDKQSPGYQLAEAARRNPALALIQTMPNADWLIGALVEGKQALDARLAAAKKPAAPAAKPKVPSAKPSPDQVATSASGAASRAPIGSAERAALAQESAKLSKKGGIGPEDAASILLKNAQARKLSR